MWNGWAEYLTDMEEFDIDLVNEELEDLQEYIHEWETDRFDKKEDLKILE